MNTSKIQIESKKIEAINGIFKEAGECFKSGLSTDIRAFVDASQLDIETRGSKVRETPKCIKCCLQKK